MRARGSTDDQNLAQQRIDVGFKATFSQRPLLPIRRSALVTIGRRVLVIRCLKKERPVGRSFLLVRCVYLIFCHALQGGPYTQTRKP